MKRPKNKNTIREKILLDALEKLMYSLKASDEDFDLRESYIDAEKIRRDYGHRMPL